MVTHSLVNTSADNEKKKRHVGFAHKPELHYSIEENGKMQIVTEALWDFAVLLV